MNIVIGGFGEFSRDVNVTLNCTRTICYNNMNATHTHTMHILLFLIYVFLFIYMFLLLLLFLYNIICTDDMLVGR